MAGGKTHGYNHRKNQLPAETAYTDVENAWTQPQDLPSGSEMDGSGLINQDLVGVPNGVAGLDAGGKVPIGQMALTSLQYQGNWDADENEPLLNDATGTQNHFYDVSVAGVKDLGSGPITFGVGDWAIHNGTKWEKVDNPNTVVSVNSKTGIVVLTPGDIGAEPADATIMKEGEDISLLDNDSDFQSGAQVSGAISGHAEDPDAHHSESHSIDPATGPHTGTIPEASIAFDNEGGHTHDGSDSNYILHGSLQDINPDDHHAQLHDLNGGDHTGITGIENNLMALDANGKPKDSGSAPGDFDVAGAAGAVQDNLDTHAGNADAHHAESHAHNGVDGSGTVAHSATTGKTANDHHNQVHNLDGVDHTGIVGTENNFMALDANGRPKDSGSKASDFLTGTKYARSTLCIAPGGATEYAGNQTGYMCYHGFYVIDSAAQRRMPKSKVKRISLNVSTNTLNSASTFTVRKNGVNTAIVLTVPALTTGIFTATGSVDYVDGDFFSIEGVLGGTDGQGLYPKGGDIEITTEVE